MSRTVRITRRKRDRTRRQWNRYRREQQLAEGDRAPDWLRNPDREHPEIYADFGRRRRPTSTIPLDLRPLPNYVSCLSRLGWRCVMFSVAAQSHTFTVRP